MQIYLSLYLFRTLKIRKAASEIAVLLWKGAQPPGQSNPFHNIWANRTLWVPEDANNRAGRWMPDTLSIAHTENHSKQAVANELTQAPFSGNLPACYAGFWSAGFSIKLWTWVHCQGTDCFAQYTLQQEHTGVVLTLEIPLKHPFFQQSLK